jgi:hypothetical protein
MVFRIEPIHDGGSGQLISRFGAEKVYGRTVQINKPGVGVHINRIWRILNQEAEFLLALPQGLLRPLAVGDIIDHP